MENEGMNYYYKHETGKPVMEICDASTAHEAAPGYEERDFDEPDIGSESDTFIWNWSMGHEITPNQYALTEYDPLQPQSQTELAKVVNIDHGHEGTYEIFD